ncbi:methionine ABC transporter ATP-binding protein [Stenotrophomonas sp. ESTM1D_MKCIP4_1]|uniref:ABC transporter ATP-binding protein n=1 Tax=Stenotrophomonas sp. ESTM1D_MKCIP4_1 TaxID=2072414 RepID=UPI000D53EF85|nr:ATP-binding cassette domain-containing protein [Stenotrophomonas sp. ESTM1D_MKCIP4_1]AWH53607.1 methionine ABC transporter ATP-binding protein [Stenotrophomonas sp. ESTM1D_MKCIP4_1]
MSSAAVIALDQVRFSYGGRTVLDIPKLQMEAGSSVLLRGASGSGKSTLLGLLAGVLRPERGEVRVAGMAVHALKAAARDRFRADHLGVIFQQFNLLPFLSVRDNIALGLRFSTRRSERVGRAVDAEIARLLQALLLDPDLLPRRAGTLSVGQQQRVAAARALIGRPEVLLADEPTSALDRDAATAFLQLLATHCAAAGTTTVVVSHDDSLQPLFDRVVQLQQINHAGTARV